jgi:hypothetical protein
MLTSKAIIAITTSSSIRVNAFIFIIDLPFNYRVSRDALKLT